MADPDVRRPKADFLATAIGALALAAAMVLYLRRSPGALELPRLGLAYLKSLSWQPSPTLLSRAFAQHAGSLLVFTGLVLSAFVLGSLLGGRRRHDTALDHVVALAIGFATLMLTFHALALASALYLPVLAVVALGPLFVLVARRQAAPRARAALRTLTGALRSLTPRARLATYGIAVLSLLALPWTLAPEISYDALLYHLGVPQKLLLAHRFEAQPNHSFSFHPMNVGFLLAYGHALFSVEVAKLVLWLLGLLNAGLIAYAARRYFASTATAILLAFFYLAMPFVFMEMTRVWIDLAVSFFVLCALLLLLRYQERAWPRDLRLAGFFAGIALGSKYTSVVELVALEAVLIFSALLDRDGRGPRRRWLRDLVTFNAIAAALIAPLLLRNAVVTGNPVFPLATGVFATPTLIQYDEVQDYLGPMQRGDESFPRFWYRMFFESPFLECVAGPLPLMGLFALSTAFSRRATPAHRLLAVYVVAQASAFFASRLLVLRYGSAELAVLLVLSAGFWERTRRAGAVGAAARGLAIAVSLYLLVFAHAFAAVSTGAIEYSLGLSSRARYLREHLMTSYYDAASFLNRHSESVSRVLLVGEGRAFYHENDFVVDGPYMEHSTIQQLAEAAATPAALAASLKALGISHLLVNSGELLRLRSVQFTWNGITLQRYLAFLDQHTVVVYDCAGVIIHEILEDPVPAATAALIDEPRFYLDHRRSREVKELLAAVATNQESRQGQGLTERLERLVVVAPRSRGSLDRAASLYRELGNHARADELSERSRALRELRRPEPLCPDLHP